ncbi:MAG: flap structure-specific endonuclease, partial [Candidatus Diapherotrites archaeon]|nr:flap structure-specific endonuclease [Candidatus Diapherotrites archaeon]
CQKGDVYATASQDFDSLLFGSPKLIRNLTITGRRKLPGKDVYIDVVPEYLTLEGTLKELGIDRKQLIWIGILVGTDFNEKVPGIGPKTALKLVKDHDKFESILDTVEKKVEFDYKELEDLFLNIPKSDKYKLKWEKPNHDKIKKFLCEKHDFSEDRVNNALASMEGGVEKQAQGRLDAFFG